MKPRWQLKRVYEAAAPADGYRVLVDRLWPRGLSKATLHLDEWAKDLAPSAALRSWYGHDPARWNVFRDKYETELRHNAAVQAFLEAHAQRPVVTLLFAAKEERLSNAAVLKNFLEKYGR